LFDGAKNQELIEIPNRFPFVGSNKRMKLRNFAF
jgi:hypothetical protein